MQKLGELDGERVGRPGALTERRLKSGMEQSADLLRAWLR